MFNRNQCMFAIGYQASVLSSFHTINRRKEFALYEGLIINFHLCSFHCSKYGQTLVESFEANPKVFNFIGVLLRALTV